MPTSFSSEESTDSQRDAPVAFTSETATASARNAPVAFSGEVASSSARNAPITFTSQAAQDSMRDAANLNYYGERVSVYSTRGAQVLVLENGNGFRLENGEYLQMEGSWPAFSSEVSVASSRD